MTDHESEVCDAGGRDGLWFQWWNFPGEHAYQYVEESEEGDLNGCAIRMPWI